MTYRSLQSPYFYSPSLPKLCVLTSVLEWFTHVWWGCFAQRLDTEVNNVAGDVFVAAACVAYCGAFTNVYREKVQYQRSNKLV